MFLNFYGLREQPFGVTPDPRFLYLSHTHREVISSLIYGIESDRGFLGLIAGPGMGKTTLLFQLLNRFRNVAKTAFVFQTQCNSRELLRHILNDFGVQTTDIRDDTVMMHQAFNDLLTREVRAGRKCLIIIDEAQDLKPSALEALRLLSNFETPRSKLVQIVISGQMLLAERLAEPSMSQLLQRISSTSRLLPMSESDVSEYIDHRLHVAGFKGDSLFTPGAREMIALKSEGVPRRINGLCFNAMSLGYAMMAKRIDEYMIDEVAADLALPEPNSNMRVVQKQDVPTKLFCMPDNSVARDAEDCFEAALDSPQVYGSRSALKPTADCDPMTVSRRAFPAMQEPAVHCMPSAVLDPRIDDDRDRRAQHDTSGEDLSDLRERVSKHQPEKSREPRKSLRNFTLIVAVLLGTTVALGITVALTLHGRLDKLLESTGLAASKESTPVTLPASPETHDGQSVDIPSSDIESKPPVRSAAVSHKRPASPPSLHTEAPGRGREKNAVDSTIPLNTLSPLKSGKTVPSSPRSTPLPASAPSISTSTPQGAQSMSQAALQGHQTSPELISMVRPTYPPTVSGTRVVGTVVLEAVVDRSGNVERVNVVQGDSRLVPAAVSALKQWKYIPSYRNGVPVKSVTTVSINISPSE